MNDWSKIDKDILCKYTRSIVHMRRQFQAKRFGLVFGTGLTQPLGIPGWYELNLQIAEDPRVNGKSLLGEISSETISELLEKNESRAAIALLLGSGPEETIMTQRLYEHFKAKKYEETPAQKHHTIELDSDIQREWRNVIRDKLYSKAVPKDSILSRHKYLNSFVPIIQNTPLTINYNFDDIIELALAQKKLSTENNKLARGYETCIDIRMPPRHKRGVIYHPNGYIPRNVMEAGSEGIVLSEDEFAERLIEMMTGQFASLLHHFTQNTCLFIGLSLKDNILKNLLRQSALVTPGNYHYYVYYYKKEDKPSLEQRKCIQAANFATYNLITLFLNDKELNSLGKILTSGYNSVKDSFDNNDIIHLADEISAELVYCYYIVGAVGAGKSTVTTNLRNLVAHDEWIEDRLPELAEDWHRLEKGDQAEKKKKIDEWLAKQFKKKNYNLIDEKIGIVVCDRCPLDPIVFTPKPERQAKAKFLLETICPGRSRAKLKPGQIILLIDEPEALENRIRRTNKKYRKEHLKEMQDDLKNLYKLDGMKVVDTRFSTLYEVMKRVSRIIHLEQYRPSAIHKRLSDIKEGKYEI